ncbi:hypothetical protein C5F49_06555 [Nitrosopumilus oxyclinae]|uniref:Uncharacterized protein n=1 Tax=Nitrosopumilus oxyclinae TaxID=1959104 RepID=A0A7D5M205_9ARCH|nr:hypothetical protein [Nitrosopumilus oxyclinae]QLH05013.1 hypothetical protein C5F49_06555 [Nitrosopumilus oxyclinae]
MKDPHNYAKVGYSMIVVSASLAAIAIIGLFIADDVLLADNWARDHTAHFNECKANDFVAEDCVKYRERINNEASGIYVDPAKWK